MFHENRGERERQRHDTVAGSDDRHKRAEMREYACATREAKAAKTRGRLMSQSMRRMGTIVGAVVVCGAVVWMAAPAMALPAGSVANVIVNGDFESGPDWGGLNNPPQGWEQLLGGRQRLMHRSRVPMR